MNAFPHASETCLTIADVERDTGVSKDTLRIWERRYGFPVPVRDGGGDRLYPAEQVNRLRVIRRLLDQGHRAGKLLTASPTELTTLAGTLAAHDDLAHEASEVLQRVRQRDLGGVRLLLGQMLARRGLQRFIIECMPPLLAEIGESWARGDLAIFEEHMVTEALQNTVRSALHGLNSPKVGRPVVLLTTLPDEQHGLGLLMAQGLLEPEGATCLPLGPQTPLADIREACEWASVDIVALSVSAAYPTRQAISALRSLRAMLPAAVALWAGGNGIVRRRRSLAGIRVIDGIEDSLAALAQWRAEHGKARSATTPGPSPHPSLKDTP